MKLPLSIFVTITVLSGCVPLPPQELAQTYSSGISVNELQMAALQDKEATQSDVQAALGQPSLKTTLQKGEMWRYDYTEFNASKRVDINETSVFEFDNKGLLITHYKTNGTAHNPLTGK